MQHDNAAAEQSSAVPVVIVAGFLGAGKTSFLKNYLNNRTEHRIGLVRNEFAKEEEEGGEDPIFEEPLLIDEADASAFKSFIEFPNTCEGDSFIPSS